MDYENLFTDNNRSVSHDITAHDGIDSNKAELLGAMTGVKNSKALGPDGIQNNQFNEPCVKVVLKNRSFKNIYQM